MSKKQILFIWGWEALENLSSKNFLEQKRNFYKNNYDFNPFTEKSSNWKDDLEEKIFSDFDFIKMQKPMSDCADYEIWKTAYEKTINFLWDNLVLIGHSLGAIFLIKYFCENPNKIKNIKKIFLIATPLNDSESEVLGSFCVDKTMLQNLEHMQNKIIFFHSIDDEIVDIEDFYEYKKNFIDSEFIELNNYWHFIFNKNFPELLEKIKKTRILKF